MADAEIRLLKVLRDIAKEYGYDDTNIDLKPISTGGANYASLLYSTSLSSPEKDDLRLFSKIAAFGEELRSMSKTQVYEVEVVFYTKILPKLRDLEESHSISVENRLVVPKYYGGVIDYLKELMVIEDLTPKGFKPIDRFKYIDWNFASACVEELARFHALSVAFKQNNPEEYAEITEKLKFSASRESLSGFINKSVAKAIEATDEVNRGLVKTFLLNEMKEESFFKFYDPDRKVLLTHGDFRPSNILQKLDANGKLQVALVDYQLVRHGNPVTDLVYFLICGSDEEFRSKHLHQFFDHYYSTFSQSLQWLGIHSDTVYKEKDFQDDIKKLLPFGLTLATYAFLFITVEEDKARKPGESEDFGLNEMKASDQYQIRFNALVRDYVTLGIL